MLHVRFADHGYTNFLIMVLIIMIFVLGACQSNQPTPKPTPTQAEPTDFPAGFPTPDPDALAACLAGGGRWEVLGFSGPGCNLPTSDGGKACMESDDCESACLGDPDLVMMTDESGNLVLDHEKIEALNARDGEKTGLCSPWQEMFGCNVWLQQGRFVVICVD